MEGLTQLVAAPSSSLLIDIDEQTQVGAARRAAVALGHLHNLRTDVIGRLAIVVTEAATNIVRHAGRGVVILRWLMVVDTPAVEILALDSGPGIPNLSRAMQDGYSTGGTSGQGLGAIGRLSMEFQVHSQHGMGTALFARVGTAKRPSSGARARGGLQDRLGVVSVPLRGETECGDAWHVTVGRQRVAVMLVDGLGHGPGAAAAAALAVAKFSSMGNNGSPELVLAGCDEAMRGSRGAALALTVVDEAARTTVFVGVGNVDGRVLADGSKAEHLVPQNGIVGHTMPTVRSTHTAWPAGACLIMHSDGISARWNLSAYEKLTHAHPALIAGLIFRDFGRSRDDATVVVLTDSPAAKAR